MRLNEIVRDGVAGGTCTSIEAQHNSRESNTKPSKHNQPAQITLGKGIVECTMDEKTLPAKLMDYELLAAKYKVQSSAKPSHKMEQAPPKRKTGRITLSNRKINVETDKSPKGSKSLVNDCLQQANLNSFLQIKDVAGQEVKEKPVQSTKKHCSANSKENECNIKQAGSFKVSNNLFMSPRRKQSARETIDIHITAGTKLTSKFKEALGEDDDFGDIQVAIEPAEIVVANYDSKPLATILINENSVDKSEPIKDSHLTNGKEVNTPTLKTNAFHFLMDRSKVTPPSEKSSPKETSNSKKRKLELPDEGITKKAKRKKSGGKEAEEMKKVVLEVDVPEVHVKVIDSNEIQVGENRDKCKPKVNGTNDAKKSPKNDQEKKGNDDNVVQKRPVGRPRKQKQMPPPIFKLKRSFEVVNDAVSLDSIEEKDVNRSDPVVHLVEEDKDGKKDDVANLRRSTRERKSIIDLSQFNILCDDMKNGKTPKSRRQRRSSESSVDSVASSTLGKRGRGRPKKETISAQNGPKVAPLFDKAKPKPKPITKLSPASMAARENFLRSSVPDVLKKKHQQAEEARLLEEEFLTFPALAHVQQRCASSMWSLPSVNLPLTSPEVECREYIEDILKRTESSPFSCDISPNNADAKITFAPLMKGLSLYAKFQEILDHNPNYPVRHCFVSFGDRNGLNYRPPKHGNKSKSKVSLSKLITQGKPEVVAENLNQHTMWTEKYRPRESIELLGNNTAVQALKSWLKSWLDVVGGPGGEMFDIDGASQLKTAMILYGSAGCGKTATLYALCEELSVNVLEVNISSRRTGKQLLQQMTEATQSHQVRKRTDQEVKMCLLLIDDADLVYQQDEHFTRELHTLISSSKRPIVLTTNDYSVPHLMRYVNQQYPLLSFAGLSASSMATYLQILCAMEGVDVEHTMVGRLLEWNQGDMRRTLLQLQFWLASGGDLLHEGRGHNKCIQAFISHPERQILPEPLDLGQLWWNVPKITGADASVQPQEGGTTAIRSNDAKTVRELKDYAKFMNSISFCDTLNHTERIPIGIEPEANNLELLDTIELNPRIEEFKSDRCLTGELQYCLLDGHCKKFSATRTNLTPMSTQWSYAPPVKVRRWRGKQQNAATEFKDAISLQVKCDRKSFVEDYFPCVREFARAEEKRRQNNPRRGNRGFNILGTIGIYDITPSDMKTACNMFQNKICANL